MPIVISLTPEVEARLRDKAAREGQNVSLLAAELIANALEWEMQDVQEAVEGIQHGLNDFEAGRFRSFDDSAKEQEKQTKIVIQLQLWLDEEDDADEQRETGEYLIQALDEDRLSDRKLFPSEMKGVTW
jgi:predicted transcriptional regulator